MGQDLRKAWGSYLDDERDKAQERAEGSDDEDDAVRSFGDYLDERYRRRRKVGIILFGVGFAPLGFGLYTGIALGEGRDVALGIAGVGGALIVSGAVVWAVRDLQLRNFRRARKWAESGGHARLRWRGFAPLYDPWTRMHGLGVGFAF